MDYKLSLKLKNAGYPQKGEFFFGKNVNEEWEARHQDHWAEFSFTGFEEGPICPTLSELIEECLKLHCVFRLYCWEHGFVVGFQPEERKDDMEICKTPEEAVANLWLKLNK